MNDAMFIKVNPNNFVRADSIARFEIIKTHHEVGRLARCAICIHLKDGSSVESHVVGYDDKAANIIREIVDSDESYMEIKGE